MVYDDTAREQVLRDAAVNQLKKRRLRRRGLTEQNTR